MKHIYKLLGIISLTCLSAGTVINVPTMVNMEPTVSAAARIIHGITRAKAERWAWWHFYTSHQGYIPNGSDKIPINNKNFVVVSWWTRGHKQIVVKIVHKDPGHGSVDYRVYRVSKAGNLKLRNDGESFSSVATVWNIVSRQYHELNTNDPAQQINTMSPNDLKYQKLTPMETAAAILIYYDKVQGGGFVKKGMQENGFDLSQTKVTKRTRTKPGRGICYGIKPVNDNVQEYFYTVGSNGKVYMYVNDNIRPSRTVKLQTIVKYINRTKQQQKVEQIAGMFHVQPVKHAHK